MAQKFWNYPNGVYVHGVKCVQTLIPDNCPHCHTKITVEPFGSEDAADGITGNSCIHVETYDSLWNMRITEVKAVTHTHADGMACKICKDYNHYGQPNQADGTYHCYKCRH